MKAQPIIILALLLITVLSLQTPCDPTICQCQNSTCVSCLVNEFYYDPPQKTCRLCPPECRTCNDKQQCMTCRDMFLLSDTSCLACPKFCRTCTLSICTQCISGYILINSICQKCQVPNVQTCESLMTVKTCLAGYWKNGDSCSPCREFCEFCTSSNNCLRCQAGYRTRVSAGTYCVACGTGCRSCSDTGCTQCAWNYRLVNGTCSSIMSNCSLIAHCQSCDFANNTVRCLLCTYPYYISPNSTCVKGSSILCRYSNSPNPYQCLNECSAMGYASTTVLSSSRNINQVICLPRLWIENTVVEQVAFNALYSGLYAGMFVPLNVPYAVCGSEYITSAEYSNLANVIKLTRVFPPYYKLVIHTKFLPIFKSVLPSTMGLNLNARMTDNATNVFAISRQLNGTQLVACQQQYLTMSSRIIKDQSVTIEFSHQLTSSTYTPQQLAAAFPNGLIGYRQLLIQVYRCDSRCRICSNAKYCLECYGSLFLSSNKCVASCDGLFQFYLPNGNYLNFQSKYCLQQCPLGYFSTLHPQKNATFICLKCPDQCRTCKASNQCLSCVAPYLLFASNFSCNLTCPNTHYSSLATLQCLSCNAPCRTCANEAQCLSCSIGYFDGKKCVGSCPQGTYSSDSIKQCLACDSKCSTCQNTPTFCTACNQPYKLLGTSCLDSCPNSTHYTQNFTCLPCKSPCTLCSSQTQCITCSRGYLFNRTCLTDCPIGYYRDVGNSRCNLCENNCLTCLSLSICRSCVPGTYLFNTMCLPQCPLKTYTSPSNVCIPCIPPCLTCFNDTKCITCSLGFLSQLSPFTCVNQCEDGYFGQSSNQTCMKCSSSCKTCSQQQNFCLTCNTGLLLENNACVASCSSNYFSFNNQKCRPCSYPCRTCVQISSKCLTCQDPFILSGQNKCSLQCLSTQYRKNGACLACESPCASCTEIDTCTSCRVNSTSQTYLLNGNCFSFCPTSMYADVLTLRCRACVFPCSTCLSSRECLSCVSGYLNVVKKSCEVCSSSYYPDEVSRTCKLCSSALANCQQCQSSTVCKVCDVGHLLMNTTCISEGQCRNRAGYFVNVQLKRCSECSPPCRNCVNSTFCTSCQNGNLFQGRCPFTCPAGFYANQTAKECLACNYSICRTCANSPNECTACAQSSLNNVFFVQNKTCIAQNQCPQAYYLDDLFGYWRCLKCIPPCRTCSSASTCLSCTAGVLFRGSCSFSCPNKHYANSSASLTLVTCEQCSTSCLQCSQSSSNCISCPVTKLLQDNVCVDRCSPKYYHNQYILECLKCQSPCLQCQSATYCKSCDNLSKILYYGQCIDICPEGTYISNNSCIPCPASCQICTLSSQSLSPICQKCSQNLFMNSSSYGKCQTTCFPTQYPDSQTRKCYQCQVPCKQCHTATRCKTCIDGYLIYMSDCLKGDECRLGTFMDPFAKMCLDQCYAPYFGDNLTRMCSEQCAGKRLKLPIEGNRVCTQRCPLAYVVNSNFTCHECAQGQCSDILSYEIYVKSIFNRLYIKVKFSKQVLTNLINESNTRVFVTDLSLVSTRRLLAQSSMSTRRLLAQSSMSAEEYTFKITERSARAVWLELDTYKTLKKVSVKIHFLSYYLLSPIPGSPNLATNLQSLNQSVLISRFDHYTTDEQQAGKSFETFSILLSLVLFAIIVLSLLGNFLSLFYHLIDYFQILFMLSFLQIDYSPGLNYFLYGFRYSHYLFFPQIFRPQELKEYSETPGKFGIIVPDADFLSNTGHDFLIIFVCMGVVMAVKLADFLLTSSIKNNKVSNDPSDNPSSQKHSISIKNQLEEHSAHQKPQQNSSTEHEATSLALNRIELQMLEGKHGQLAKFTKIFISRLKWNYFNDICYCLYFYIALFTYSHMYILSEAPFMSSLFAFIGVGFTLVLPGFFMYLLNKQRGNIESQGMQHKVYLPFKTFYYCTLPDSSYTLYNIPIRYLKKLIVAMLLVYCSQFPQFVLGIIMMMSLLNAILTYLYKPYILTFEVYIQVGIEMLFVSMVFCLCLMELEYLDLDTGKKLVISQVVVGLTILLTILLIVWNAIRFTVEVVKQFCGKDYFQNYHKQPLQQSSTHQTTKRSSRAHSLHQPDHQIHQQSNVRLQEGFSKYESHSQLNHRKSQNDQYSALDIYLKRENDAPPMLIKCIKNFSDKENSDDDESEKEKSSEQSKRQSQNDTQKHEANGSVRVENKRRTGFKQSHHSEEESYRQEANQEYGFSEIQQGQNSSKHQVEQSFQDFEAKSHDENDEDVNTEPRLLEQIELPKELPQKPVAEQDGLKITRSYHLDEALKNQLQQLQQPHSQTVQSVPPYDSQQENETQQVNEMFVQQPNSTPNKMKTIMQIQDFNVQDESQNHTQQTQTDIQQQEQQNNQTLQEKQNPQNFQEQQNPQNLQERQHDDPPSNITQLDSKQPGIICREIKVESVQGEEELEPDNA